MLEDEGYQQIFARHAACAAAAQRRTHGSRLQLFADPAHASQTVTAAWLPEGVDWSALNKAMRARGLVLAGGQDRLAGQILRIGHLGDVSPTTWSPRSGSSANRSGGARSRRRRRPGSRCRATAARRRSQGHERNVRRPPCRGREGPRRRTPRPAGTGAAAREHEVDVQARTWRATSFLAALPDYDALSCAAASRWTRRHSPSARACGSSVAPGVGVDNIDVPAATGAGVAWSSTRPPPTRSPRRSDRSA